MRVQLPHCPSCGAPLEVPEGASRATCGYCGATLVIEHERVSNRTQRAPVVDDEEAPYPEPEATSWNKAFPRFELSVIEQKVPGTVPELFAGLELSEQRFAFVSMRVIDRDGKPMPHDLTDAFEALRRSLADDGDPGLAANVALDLLCRRPFDHRLEVAVVLFEPKHMNVTPYAAGMHGALCWASGEEGRTLAIDGHRSALERKLLREAGDHFENGRPIQLADNDLVLIPSAGFTGRGARSGGDGIRALHEVSNAHLGEEPLRVVTLAKNAFWAELQKRSSHKAPVGDVRVAAVRAVTPRPVTSLPREVTLQTLKTRRSEVSLLVRANERVVQLPLRDDRQVVVWASPRGSALSDDEFSRGVAAVLEVLDGTNGDNENPRQAGRRFLGAVGRPAGELDLAIMQFIEEHQRFKYFRAGWKQPVPLGARGLKSNVSIQQFDEGGEATVGEGERLFFPGSLRYEGQRGSVAAFSEVWSGGKASLLYGAFAAHWKTKKTDRALEGMALAALGDEPEATLSGLALVTGLKRG